MIFFSFLSAYAEAYATVRDVKLVAVRLPCRLTARKLNNATSPLGYLSEGVTDETLALFAPPVTAEAVLARDATVSFLFTEENEEGCLLIFHAGSIPHFRRNASFIFAFFHFFFSTFRLT